jgi:hypothetical protein
LKAIGSQGKNL